MIVKRLRKFLKQDDVVEYLEKYNRQNLEYLELVLAKLDFTNNFGGFIYEGPIAATTELAIPNQLKPLIPSSRIILRSDSVDIVDGQTWTSENVYIENLGATDANVKILFLP